MIMIYDIFEMLLMYHTYCVIKCVLFAMLTVVVF